MVLENVGPSAALAIKELASLSITCSGTGNKRAYQCPGKFVAITCSVPYGQRIYAAS